MSKDVFASYDEVSKFIIDTMPNRGGTYYYQEKKINFLKNAFTLFQYDGKLIGYAVYSNTVTFDESVTFDDGNLYNGYYQFFPDSIHLFENTILTEEYKIIDSSFKKFGQGARKTPVGYLPLIMDVINKDKHPQRVKVAVFTLPEEIQDEKADKLIEGAKKTIVVNAYERNPHARAICISHYRAKNNGRIKCEICDFDFGKIYGEAFSEKIHIHHIKEISLIGEEYEINAITDLLPICPNCHMIAHSKIPAYTPDEIREMIGKEKNDK